MSQTNDKCRVVCSIAEEEDLMTKTLAEKVEARSKIAKALQVVADLCTGE